MKRLRSWVRAFFGFSRTETNAFLLLLPLMFLVIFIIPTYKAFFTHQEKDYSKEKKELDSLVATWKDRETEDSITSIKSPTSLFAFNPNCAHALFLEDSVNICNL